ncbi:MAG: saccharopine dehydrogenase NADP-binding domain-containing protein [Flavobacteriales bacterium]|nr:saccharopine dehydrogenase NADP-binding domain-containing protein [Flavobacteriales bacterium]
MKEILLIGAGRSTYSLIKYLSKNAVQHDWKITIADRIITDLKSRFDADSRIEIIEFDVNNQNQRETCIKKSNIVISMLPAHMHIGVAKDCIRFKKHMVTASYISDEMKALFDDAVDAGITIINEIGVDPGIDHLSAMKVIDEIRDAGGEITGFETFTGGLVAPESDDNPWNYKFTWNPRNVVLAGQGGAVKFLHNGKYKYIPYHKLFDRTEIIHIDEYGDFEGYANRDSLKYIDLYGLQGVKTMYRGTFRRPPFCRAWHILVQIGATDDSYIIEDSENMTYREFINTFLKYREKDSVEIKLAYYLSKDVDGDEMRLLEWLGLFENKKIGIANATPAQILLHLLEQKWALEEGDKDMIVMWHLLTYKLNGQKHRLESSMVVEGEDKRQTAMAKTVGYPIGIATKLILNDKIKKKGVLLPLEKEIYKPVLKELQGYGVIFKEKEGSA